MPTVIHTADLGLCAYSQALRAQRAAHARCQATGENLLLLVEHFPVVTVGYRRTRDQLRHPVETLAEHGIAFAEVERGGGATYHGPGQLVAYPIFAALARRCGVRAFITRLEEVMIGICRRFGVSAHRQSGLPGVWVGGRKIGAVGIAVCNRVPLHGWALNVDLDLRPFSYIIPCGLADRGVTSLAGELRARVPMGAVRDCTRRVFAEVFAAEMEELPDEWCRIEREPGPGAVDHHQPPGAAECPGP